MNTPEYILHASRDEEIGEVSLKRGNSYFLSRQNAAELLAASDHADVHPPTSFWLCNQSKPIRSDSWNGRSLLFCRSGGIGDILATTPAMHEIKTVWPASKIIYATHARHAPILENNPDVDQIIPWPVSTEEWDKAGNPLWLDGLMEDDAKARETHFVDLVADQIGLPLIADKRMRYFVRHQEREVIRKTLPKTRKRLGIQVHATAINRTYPWKQLREVVIHFMQAGWEVALFGSPNILKNTGEPGIIFANNLGLRIACALVETCDAFIAPDSAFCHIAGALNVPTVALYGPFPWKIRTKYADSIHPIQGNAKCAPCFHHVRKAKQFCDACPSADKGFCQAMADINPQRIIRAVEEARR